MIIAIAVVFLALIVTGIVLGRQTKRRKKEAIADLERQREEIAQKDIFALILEEVDDLDLRSIAGADDLQPAVLLKTWKDHATVVEGCPDRSRLRFVVADGVDPAEATDGDVTVVCDGDTPGPEGAAG